MPRAVEYGTRRRAQADDPCVDDMIGTRKVNVHAELTESELASLIPRFYARVREDALIGPVFNAAIADWDDHLERLVAFWSSVMLTSGRYKGNPMAAHLGQLGAITPPMFDRWLVIWAEVTSEVLPPPVAVALQGKAARIGASLKLALYFRLPAASTAASEATAGPTTSIS